MSKYGYEDQAFPAEHYDALLYNSGRPFRDVPLYIEFARKARGKILELGCGTGRVLIPLAREGFNLTGLDISTYMLDVCRRKLAQEPDDVSSRVKLLQANMVGLQTGERYDLILIPARSFQILISQQEQTDCLRSVSAHLNPTGRLVIDVFHPYFPRLFDPKYHQEQDRVAIKLPDGRTVEITDRVAAYHKAEQYNEIELIHYIRYPDGREERLVQSFSMHYFFRFEMEHLLRLCGFRVTELFGNFDKSPLADDSPEMIFVAEKTG